MQGSHFAPDTTPVTRFSPWPETTTQTTKRVALGGFAILGTLLVLFGFFRTLQHPPTNSIAPRTLDVDVLSPRRFPDSMALAARDQATRVIVQDALNAKQAGKPGTVSLSLNRNGFDFMKQQSNMSLTPASTMKIITASAALDLLGPNTRFQTTVRSTTPQKNGAINGDLYLVGGGDPLLNSEEFSQTLDPITAHSSLDALADSVAKTGVKQINGNIVGDDSRFDSVHYLASWSPNYGTSGEVGAISALNANRGFMRFKGGRVPSPDPTRTTVELFKAMLSARGVAVSGNATTGVTPKGASQIAVLDSPTMSEIVEEMLTNSDNTVAEVVTKNIGFAKATSGTTQSGASVVTDYVKANSPFAATFSAVDGSGLDQGDRASCDLLDDMVRKTSTANYLHSAFPRAGETGTLKTRMRNSAAVGHVQAKTGTLFNVSGLAGWAEAPNQDPTAFCVLTNQMGLETAQGLQDAVAIAIATGAQAPEAEVFRPKVNATAK